MICSSATFSISGSSFPLIGMSRTISPPRPPATLLLRDVGPTRPTQKSFYFFFSSSSGGCSLPPPIALKGASTTPPAVFTVVSAKLPMVFTGTVTSEQAPPTSTHHIPNKIRLSLVTGFPYHRLHFLQPPHLLTSPLASLNHPAVLPRCPPLLTLTGSSNFFLSFAAPTPINPFAGQPLKSAPWAESLPLTKPVWRARTEPASSPSMTAFPSFCQTKRRFGPFFDSIRKASIPVPLIFSLSTWHF